MQHSAEMRRCLESCDVAQLRKLWAHIAPNMPQPQTDADALVSLHIARTKASTLAFNSRAYSHRWLTDQGLPSGLPDNLKPKADRLFPRIVEGVGISVNAASALFKPITTIVRGAMEDAVMEAYCDKHTEPEFVKQRMMEAKEKAVRKLLGI